jgi:hypothetical protein
VHYELSRKTKSRKGEQMKRVALLSVFSMLLAAAVFAPVALAQEAAPGEVDVTSVTLGPGGSATITGTIECVEGSFYQAGVMLRQRAGNSYKSAQVDYYGTCATSGPEAFTAAGFSDRPFHKGPAVIQPFSYLWATSTSWQGAIEAVNIR